MPVVAQPSEDAVAAAFDAVKSQPTISVKEYALIVGVHRTTAYEHAESGALPTIRVGRTIRVPSSFVLRQLGLDPAGA